jgi:hypothetical protein
VYVCDPDKADDEPEYRSGTSHFLRILCELVSVCVCAGACACVCMRVCVCVCVCVRVTWIRPMMSRSTVVVFDFFN